MTHSTSTKPIPLGPGFLLWALGAPTPSWCPPAPLLRSCPSHDHPERSPTGSHRLTLFPHTSAATLQGGMSTRTSFRPPPPCDPTSKQLSTWQPAALSRHPGELLQSAAARLGQGHRKAEATRDRDWRTQEAEVVLAPTSGTWRLAVWLWPPWGELILTSERTVQTTVC